MLLALPFQGLASAAMLSCAHGSQQMPMQMPMQTPADSQQMAPDGHCHDDMAPAAAPAHHADHDQASHDHDGRCSACAACCIGAAMAPAPLVAAAPPSSPQLVVPAASARLLTVDLDLPERPPRPSFA